MFIMHLCISPCNSRSYLKGASVNRMLYTVLGADAFKSGLQLYMSRHAYSNTETTDLWAALGDASKQDVKAIMASWTEQMGYPLVRVVEATSAAGKTVLQLQQEWFLADGTAGDGRLWVVPVIVSTPNGVQPTQLMAQKTFLFEMPEANSWVKINSGQTVPCRVLYTSELFSRLVVGVR
jgi:puromycin-sensitive aminopeptidase